MGNQDALYEGEASCEGLPELIHTVLVCLAPFTGVANETRAMWFPCNRVATVGFLDTGELVMTAITIICRTLSRVALAWLGLLAVVTSVRGAGNDWAEGTPGKDNGASRDCYNRAGQLEWQNKMGDWRDARDVAQGNEPYATAAIKPEHKGRRSNGTSRRSCKSGPVANMRIRGCFFAWSKGKGRTRSAAGSSKTPPVVRSWSSAAMVPR